MTTCYHVYPASHWWHTFDFNDVVIHTIGQKLVSSISSGPSSFGYIVAVVFYFVYNFTVSVEKDHTVVREVVNVMDFHVIVLAVVVRRDEDVWHHAVVQTRQNNVSVYETAPRIGHSKHVNACFCILHCIRRTFSNGSVVEFEYIAESCTAQCSQFYSTIVAIIVSRLNSSDINLYR